MRKFTNLMRLLMAVVLSITIVAGYAQRSTPMSNKAPQQQMQVVSGQQTPVVQLNNDKSYLKSIVKEQAPVTQFNYFGSQEVAFSYDKPTSSEPYDPSKYPVPDQGGENFATAVVISSLPFTANGTTSGYLHDYDAVCPYGPHTSPDVVYSYTPATNKTIQLSLCNDPTNYDSKLFVMDAAQTVIACNDDYCSTASYSSPYVSYIGAANLTGGTTYYIVVDGYGGSSGNYQLTVVESTPCIVTCPPGSTLEGEGTIPDEGVDNFNGGCNSTPNVWGSIVPGQTICGTANTYTVAGGQSRDTDWYRFDGTTYGSGTWDFTFTAQAEFDLLIFIIKTNGGACAGQTFWSATAAPCATATVSVTGVANDIFDFWVGPSVFSGYPPSGAPYDYTATLTGTFTPYATYDCNWTVELWDAYGDGWNGGLLDVVVDGFTYLNDITLGSGYGPATYSFGTNEGSSLVFNYTGGSWAYENYYKVYDNYGVLVYASPDNFNGPPPATVNLTGTCVPPACPPPSNLGATNITTNSADLTWTSNSGLSNIEFGPAGFTPTGVPTYSGVTSPYPVGGLTSGASYSFYIQDDCGVNGTSVWVGPYTFSALCDVPCPPGAILEGEADIPDDGTDFTNGGCNSSPFVYSTINIGDVICGRANTYLYTGLNYRDTDWYRLDLTGTNSFWDITWTVTAEFPLIIFVVDAGTENCADYTVLGNTTAGVCQTASLTFTGLAPKVYWVLAMPSVFSGVPPSDYVASLTGTALGLPQATFNPGSFNKQLAVGGSTTDVLNVGNSGTYGLTYTANVNYGAKASATVYPVNANYWTGTVDNTTPPAVFSQTSLVNGIGEEAGWFMFDISAIPDGATITSVEFHGYANACNWPYWSLTPVTSDPLTTAPDILYADIIAEEGGAGDYNYFLESSGAAPGWRVATLGGTANADLQAALAQNWFAVGMAETDHFATYFINFDGWNETNKPYLVVNYTTTPFWLTIDGAQTASGSVAGGGSNAHTIGFNATGLAPGTYTADIIFSTNEPGAKATHIVPVTLVVGYRVYGNVYYGTTGTTKPMATNTTVTLTPGSTVPTGALGYYEIGGVVNGSYKLSGATTKAWGGLQAFDATLIARYLGSIVAFTDLQKRAADLNLSNTITAFDGTLIKRKLGSIATPQWTAPDYVFDGPFPTTPVLDGMPITVSGADVTQELRTLCSGDLNSSFTPPAE